MSLMVWKPKESIIDVKELQKEKTDSKTEDNREETVRRNGVLVGDLGMDIEM